MKIKFKKLLPDAKQPVRATSGANGYDLYSAEKEARVIHPGEKSIFSTGLAIELPENICGEIVPRSGLAFKNDLTVINSPGTIDSDYRGEIKVGLRNHGKSNQVIKPGDRIAQIKFVRTEVAEFEEVDNLESSVRGEDGFGSTGLSDIVSKARGNELPIQRIAFA